MKNVDSRTKLVRPRRPGFIHCLVASLIVAALVGALPAAAAPAFDHPVRYSAGGYHNYGVAVGDFNGDGRPDLVTVSALSSELSVLLNRGDGTYDPEVRFPSDNADRQLQAVGVADMNGDGKLDVVAVGESPEGVVVFLGRGDGTFDVGRGFPCGSVNNRFLAIADFNEDGSPDVVVVSSGNSMVAAAASLLYGSKDGTFFLKDTFVWAPNSHLPAGTGVAVADFNRDGHADLAIANASGPTSVLLGHGDGTFSLQADLSADPGLWQAICVADLNRDGIPDLAGIALLLNPATQSFRSVVVAALGHGDGTFEPVAQYSILSDSRAGIAVGDFDGGGPDIAVAGYDGRVEVYSNRGDGTFQDGTFRHPADSFYLGGSRADNLLAVDLNGDGRPDLAVSTQELAGSPAGLVVLKNTTAKRLASLVLTSPVAVELGARFSMTVTAYDQFGAPFPDYRGTVYFFSSDKSDCGQVPADYTFNAADGGTHVFTDEATLLSSGQRTVTAVDAMVPALQDSRDVTVSEGLTVTTASDETSNNGQVSLREAILRANQTPRSAVKPAVIRFNLCPATDETLVLAPLSELPAVQGAVVIDGFSQPGARPNTLAIGDNALRRIVLEGKQTGSGANGLTLEGAAEVRGLEIRAFDARGIHVNKSDGGVIRGNHIHDNLTDGIDLESGNWTVGGNRPEDRNLVSGNRSSGILVHDDDPGNLGHRILGNYIGTDHQGSNAIAGQWSGGIVIIGSANTVVGGNGASARNVISGNSGPGIVVTGNSTDTVLRGNFVGPSASGVLALGNSMGIVVSNALRTVVGGATLGDGNTLSGNALHGLVVARGSQNTLIQGNRVGLVPSGKFALPNGGDGIAVLENALDTMIGGGPETAVNLISGNHANGIRLSGGSRTQLLCNDIGPADKDGAALGNGGYGIAIVPDPLHPGSPDGNVIGGILPGMQNVIAFNARGGIGATTGLKNSIRGNSIFGNGGLGIDLGTAGVNLNDSDDGDSGPNDLQNFPVLTGAIGDGANLTIMGNMAGRSGATLALDFYWSQDCGASGFGAGTVYLGSKTITSDATGMAAFSADFAAAVPAGGVVTATATSADGNTSEFSRCQPVSERISVRPFAGLDFNGLGGGRLSDMGGVLAVSNVGASGNDGLGLVLGRADGWRGEFRWPTVDSRGMRFTTTVSGDSGSITGQVLASTFYEVKERDGSFRVDFSGVDSKTSRIELRDVDGIVIGAGIVDNATAFLFDGETGAGQSGVILPDKLTTMATPDGVSVCLEFSEDVFIQNLPAGVRQALNHPGLRRLLLMGLGGRPVSAISSVDLRAALPPTLKGAPTGSFEIARSEVSLFGLFQHSGGVNLEVSKGSPTDAALIGLLNPVPDTLATASIDLSNAGSCRFSWLPFGPADVPADGRLRLAFSAFTGGDKGGRNIPVGELTLQKTGSGLELSGAAGVWSGPMARVQVFRQGAVAFDELRPLAQPLARFESWPTGAEASGRGDASIYGILVGLLFPADHHSVIEIGGLKIDGDAILVSAGQATAPVRYLETATFEFNLGRIKLTNEQMAPATLPPLDLGRDADQSMLRIPTDPARRYRLMSSEDPAATVWDPVSSFMGDGTTRAIPITTSGEASSGRFFRVWAE